MHKRNLSLAGLGALVSLCLAWTSGAAAQGSDVESLVSSCVACHGNDGNSVSADFPKIAGLGEKYLLKQLQDIRAAQNSEGGRQIDLMAGLLNSMSDADLQAIAAYYAEKPMTMSGANGDQTIKLNSGEEVDGLAVGENIYRYGDQRKGIPACSGCHSPRGLGNAPAGYPRLGGQFPGYIEQQLRNFRAGERTNDGESQVMRQVAEMLSDAEIAAVSNYIAGLH